MQSTDIEILNQETLNNKLMVEHQEPLSERVMSFKELIEFMNSAH